MDGDLVLQEDYFRIFSFILCFGVFLYYAARNFQFIAGKYRLLKTLKNAPTLSENLEPGSYAMVSGLLALPETQTPYRQKPCTFWLTIVRSEFSTKKKKPDSGMQTHRPVIHKQANDDLPLLMKTDAGELIHIDFRNNFKKMLNLNCARISKPKPFAPEIEAVARTRYKRYIADEFWIKPKEAISVWGTLTHRNSACATISGSTQGETPEVIFIGKPQEIYSALRFKILVALSYFLWLALIGYLCWLLFNTSLHPILLGLCAVAIGVSCIHVQQWRDRNPLRHPDAFDK